MSEIYRVTCTVCGITEVGWREEVIEFMEEHDKMFPTNINP